MTFPRIEPTITQGNLLSFIGTIAVQLVLVVTFLVTDHATIKQHDGQIAINTQVVETHKTRVQKLEDWKDIGPRFTSTDAALLKTQTLQESQKYALDLINGLKIEFSETKKAILDLTLAVNTQSVLLRQHMEQK